MKKILLLGDSIRIHYGKYVKMALEGEAEVFYPEINCRFASFLYRNLYIWQNELGLDDSVDAVHWNAGLWDVLVMPDGETFTPPEVYRYYLDRICRTLRAMYPKAEIIFATSTSVVEAGYNFYKRFNRDIREYNAIAMDVAASHCFRINDLYGLTENIPSEYRSDMTHFNTAGGAALLTGRVVSALEEALDIRGREVDFESFFAKETNIVGI